MAVIFYIPAYLRAYTDGRNEVPINIAGQTVGEALTALWKVCPGLRDRVVTEQDEVRQHLNIFVGEENIRDCNGLATAVMNGCEITILPSVSGG
jgi:molybdopterin synthase sulfur carrier subunit